MFGRRFFCTIPVGAGGPTMLLSSFPPAVPASPTSWLALTGSLRSTRIYPLCLCRGGNSVHTSFYISKFPLKSLSLKSLCLFAPNFWILWCGLTQGCTTKQRGRAIDLCMSGLWCISPAVSSQDLCASRHSWRIGAWQPVHLTSIHDPFVLGGQRVCSWGTLPHLCLV